MDSINYFVNLVCMVCKSVKCQEIITCSRLEKCCNVNYESQTNNDYKVLSSFVRDITENTT